MSWTINVLKENEPRFVVVGYGQRVEGRVRDGRMGGPLYRGLLALEQPNNREMIPDPWRVTVPRRFAAEDNTGANRKAMVLQCSTGAQASIVFEQPIPAELVRDLRTIFRDNRGPGPEDVPPQGESDEGNQPRRKPSAKNQEGRRPRVGRPRGKSPNRGGQRVQQRHR